MSTIYYIATLGIGIQIPFPFQDCQTSYEQQCSPSSQQQCRSVTEQECTTVNEQECNTVYEEQCTTVNEQQCSQITERVKTIVMISTYSTRKVNITKISIYIIIICETKLYSLGMSNCNRTGLSGHLWRKVWGYGRGRVWNFDWTGLIGLHQLSMNNLYDEKII